MIDLLGRTIDYARISVTDKCNLRCRYCMPEQGVELLSHEDLLTFEEIQRVAACFSRLGIHTLRVTGGEPMARRGCLDLIRMLKQTEGIRRVTMTSNGILLRGRVAEAKAAGLDGLNLSIDALTPEVYAAVTRCGDVRYVLAVIQEAVDLGLPLRLNAVPLRGVNEKELTGLAALARDLPVDVRFIELMPVGCGASQAGIPVAEVRKMLEAAFGPLQPDEAPHGQGPAVYGKPAGFKGSIGLIAAVSDTFCGRCNRIRLTPEGRLKLCLNRSAGEDLRAMMRAGCTDEELTETLRREILQKPPHHGFGENIPDRDARKMNQIGG